MHSTGTGVINHENNKLIVHYNYGNKSSNVRVLYLWCLHGYITPNDNIFSSKVIKISELHV